MTTYQTAQAHYNTSPGEERLRLWRTEKEPEVQAKYEDMIRDVDIRLGQHVREIFRNRTKYACQAGGWQGVIERLCDGAEAEVEDLKDVLAEGVEEEARRIKRSYVGIAAEHPESDPTAEVRERIQRAPNNNTGDGSSNGAGSESVTSYCSPVLVDALLWEGTDRLPNTHPKRIEFDFPARVGALLEFHCIAFHADVAVMKTLYDEDLSGDRAKQKAILGAHQDKMKKLMASFSEKMSKRWQGEEERLRAAQASEAFTKLSAKRSRVHERVQPEEDAPSTSPPRRRARVADHPTILGPAQQNAPFTAKPPRGILKNASAGLSAGIFSRLSTIDEFDDWGRDSPIWVSDATASDLASPGSFFCDELLGELDDILAPRVGAPPTVSLPAANAVDARQQRTYEIYLPKMRPGDDDQDDYAATPRAFNLTNNVAKLTQQFEQRIDKGKGKAKA